MITVDMGGAKSDHVDRVISLRVDMMLCYHSVVMTT